MLTGRSRTLRRWTANSWRLLQGTAAATAAWALANQLPNDHAPFFAPIAAFVALNAPLGERGLNALRLLLGVFVGIVAGELTVPALGGGYVALALATFAATGVARALGGTPIIISQAAIGAVLPIAAADGQAGLKPVGGGVVGPGVAPG